MPEKPPHHEEDNQWIAEQILQHRKKMGMTQTDLATEIGDPRYQKYISDYENGVDHMPITRKSISNIFHLTSYDRMTVWK